MFLFSFQSLFVGITPFSTGNLIITLSIFILSFIINCPIDVNKSISKFSSQPAFHLRKKCKLTHISLIYPTDSAPAVLSPSGNYHLIPSPSFILLLPSSAPPLSQTVSIPLSVRLRNPVGGHVALASISTTRRHQILMVQTKERKEKKKKFISLSQKDYPVGIRQFSVPASSSRAKASLRRLDIDNEMK